MASVSAPEAGLSTLFSGPARYEAATAWGGLSAVLMTVVICGASIAGAFVALLVALASGATESGVDAASAGMGSLASPAGFATALGAQLLSLAVCWLAAGRGGLRRQTLQLTNSGPSWGTAIAAGALVVALTSAAEYVMYHTTSFDMVADTKWIAEGLHSPLWWGTVLVGVVFAPLWEELTFRGFLLSALTKTPLGVVGGGLVSNVAWTILHWGYSWQGLASVFLAGLVMTWLVWRTGSIKVPIIAHAIANAAALTFIYLYSPVG